MLKVLRTLVESINEEARHRYNETIGKKQSPILDTWFQTETSGIMISPIPYSLFAIPSFATLPLPRVPLALMDEDGKEIHSKQAKRTLCIKFPWPSIARTIYGDHNRYRETYFSAYDNMYFTGDGALRDAVGYYRITGRVDDVISASGHHLGTPVIEDAVQSAPSSCQKGRLWLCPLKETGADRNQESLRKGINDLITSRIGPITKLNFIQFTDDLPKTRGGKIRGRILRKIANNESYPLGDISTLPQPEVVENVIKGFLV